MDALEFIKARERMCKSLPDCNNCPLNNNGCPRLEAVIADKIVAIVEQWAKEHPHKTRQGMFLEQWPEAELTKDGVISICPIAVSAAYRNKTGGCDSPTRPRCSDCRREFWMQEVE